MNLSEVIEKLDKSKERSNQAILAELGYHGNLAADRIKCYHIFEMCFDDDRIGIYAYFLYDDFIAVGTKQSYESETFEWVSARLFAKTHEYLALEKSADIKIVDMNQSCGTDLHLLNIIHKNETHI